MALLTFLALSSVWFLGFTYLSASCVRLEGETHPFGEIGAFAGTGWLRGSTPASRRCRNQALAWAGIGLVVVLAGTSLARAWEAGTF